MAVLIPYFDLAEKIGQHVEIDAATVAELISEGKRRFGAPFAEAVRSATIVVNGRAVARLKGGRTRLAPNDSVWLLLPSGGG